jgi:pimeloyl-ACP methyl ester carboxylesterase
MAVETMPNIGDDFGKHKIGFFRSARAYDTFRAAYDTAMAGLPQPTETRDVVTSFGTVRAYRFGTDARTPLLLLPGKTSSAPMWEANLEVFAAKRSVIAIDLIGEPGLSVQSKRIADAADQATWLAELIEGLGLPKVHLLGVSFGGWSAFNLAMHEASRVASVTVLDPANLFGRITWKVIIVSLGAVIPGMPKAWRERLMSWIAGGADASDDEPVAVLIDAGMRDFKGFLPTPAYPGDEQLAAVDRRVLALIAGRSIIHNPRKAEKRARSLLKHGTVELWPDASHAISGEFPERIGERVHAFIDGVDEADARLGESR